MKSKSMIKESVTRKITGILSIVDGKVKIEIDGKVIPIEELVSGFDNYDISILLEDEKIL